MLYHLAELSLVLLHLYYQVSDVRYHGCLFTCEDPEWDTKLDVHGRCYNMSFIILEGEQVQYYNVENLHYAPEPLVVFDDVWFEERDLPWNVTV